MKTYEYGEEPIHFCCSECESIKYEIVDLRTTTSGDVLYAVQCKKCKYKWNSLQHAADEGAMLGPADFTQLMQSPPAVKGLEIKTIPCWAMGYILYRDPQGLTDEEVAEAYEFSNDWILVCTVHSHVAEHFGYTDPPEQEAGFCKYPDIGTKAGMCEDWYCKPRKEEETNA